MYIRIKFFERKGNRENEKPFFLLEIEGMNAIKLMFIEVSKHFFGVKFSEDIKKGYELAEERKD